MPTELRLGRSPLQPSPDRSLGRETQNRDGGENDDVEEKLQGGPPRFAPTAERERYADV